MKWTKWCLVATVVVATAFAGTGVALVVGQREKKPAKPDAKAAVDQPRSLVPSDEASERAKKLKALREERLAQARIVDGTVLAQYSVGRVLIADVGSGSRLLLDAELALAKTKAERLRAYLDHRDRMKKLVDLSDARFKVGRVSREDLAIARCWYMEAQIWILEQETPKKKQEKP